MRRFGTLYVQWFSLLLISLPALPANDFLEDTFYNSFDETSPLVDFYTIEAISDIDGYEIEYSSDDRWIVFQSPFLDWRRDYWNQVYAINLNESSSSPRDRRQIRRISSGIGENIHPHFYPDSKHLILSSNFHNQSLAVAEIRTNFKHDFFDYRYENTWCPLSAYRMQCIDMYMRFIYAPPHRGDLPLPLI
ncbi:hypothetical protein DdX_18410 [Ditylenchus destructor]|uniref:Uncharacterized protein n=1 Tax=Ditylenchus destructor TaxID=166010 RepID=A0AAD4MLA1_9BILA|nr:hypothetical protein DdX_18410 [Ditylenchus destructor]